MVLKEASTARQREGATPRLPQHKARGLLPTARRDLCFDSREHCFHGCVSRPFQTPCAAFVLAPTASLTEPQPQIRTFLALAPREVIGEADQAVAARQRRRRDVSLVNPMMGSAASRAGRPASVCARCGRPGMRARARVWVSVYVCAQAVPASFRERHACATRRFGTQARRSRTPCANAHVTPSAAIAAGVVIRWRAIRRRPRS